MDKELISRAQSLHRLSKNEDFVLFLHEMNERQEVAIRYLTGAYGNNQGEHLIRWQAVYKIISDLKMWMEDEIQKGKNELKNFNDEVPDLRTTQAGSAQ